MTYDFLSNEESRLNYFLGHAAWTGDARKVGELMDLGCDVNFADGLGQTALHRSTCSAVTAMLIEAGANVNARDNEGRTPLHCSSVRQYKEISELLINAGALLRVRKQGDESPFGTLKLSYWESLREKAIKAFKKLTRRYF